ncbi:MAG: TonB-dependent receptor [Holophagales bacterium]|jgi:hypothetical protein|nr:TonB-dependent receptor [Holophagales bacterium]
MRKLRQLTLVSALIAANGLNAQETTGTLTGTVRDSAGKTVAEATITISGSQLLGRRNITTDAQGHYRMPLLLPGEYSVRVSKQGFVGSQMSFSLNAGQTLSANLNLKPIETQSAEVNIVDTSSAAVDKTETKTFSSYSLSDISSIPMGGGLGIIGVVRLAPGANEMNSYIQVRGGTFGQAQTTIDGISIRNPRTGSSSTDPQAPSDVLDGLTQDIQVVQNPINAKYGFTSSGIIAVTTKTGTNQFTGSVRIKLGNDAWRSYNSAPTANRFNEPLRGTVSLQPNSTSPANVLNDNLRKTYEIALLGPIIKDKLTFTYGARYTPTTWYASIRSVPFAPTNGGTAGSTNPQDWRTYIPGFTGPDGLAYSASYLWGYDANNPSRAQTLDGASSGKYDSYKLFYQINQNHQIEVNYLDQSSGGFSSISTMNMAMGINPPIDLNINMIQSDSTKTKGFSYRGIFGSNSVFTLNWGNRKNAIIYPIGPDDPVMVSNYTWQATTVFSNINRGAFGEGGGLKALEDRVTENISANYNFILKGHNIDAGIERFNERVDAGGSVGINARRYYAVGRRHDGDYLVYNVRGSILWDLPANILNSMFNYGTYAHPMVPLYMDFRNDSGTNDQTTLAQTNSVYFNDNWTINDQWAINLGLRYDQWKNSDRVGEHFNTSDISPRFRLQWDMNGDNVHVLAFALTQSRGSLNVGTLGLNFSRTGGGIERWWLWTEGSPEPHFVSPEAFKNPKNYDYYYYFNNNDYLYLVDPKLKPEQKTELELNYRRSFNSGGYFKISAIYNTLSDARAIKVIEEAVKMEDPSGRVPENADPAFIRYQTNTSEGRRHYASAEMEWNYPIVQTAIWRLTLAGNWTFAKTTGNQVASSAGFSMTETSDLMFFEQLERLGWDRELYNPWGETPSSQRNRMRTWLTYENGGRGQIKNTVTLLAIFGGGSTTQVGNDYYLPNGTFNINYNNLPTSVYIYPRGRGHRRGGYSYSMNLQWNAEVPIYKTLCFFSELQISNVFNSIVGSSTLGSMDSNTRNYAHPMDDPYFGQPRFAITGMAGWGVPIMSGSRDFLSRFDVGIRF